MSEYDYTGKKVHMGIDVHKKTYVCAGVCEHKVVKRDAMPADPKILIRYIKNNFKNGEVNTAYEAGFSGFHLHRLLTAENINNIVVHPASIEIASRDRVKTDKRDAKKMAIQLEAGRLKGVYVPTAEQEAKRNVSRLRDKVIKMRHRVGQRLKSLLFTQGLIDHTDRTVFSKEWLTKKRAEISQRENQVGFEYTFNYYAKQWLRFTDDLEIIKRDLLKMQSKEEMAILELYKSAPGIGMIGALKLKDELGDMSQFRNEKSLFSYLGLTPVEYSSGDKIRQGGISRQGRPMLRHMLIEAAWTGIRCDKGLNERYTRLAKRRGAKRAIVGVARNLAGRLRSCIRQNTPYKVSPLQTVNSTEV